MGRDRRHSLEALARSSPRRTATTAKQRKSASTPQPAIINSASGCSPALQPSSNVSILSTSSNTKSICSSGSVSSYSISSTRAAQPQHPACNSTTAAIPTSTLRQRLCINPQLQLPTSGFAATTLQRISISASRTPKLSLFLFPVSAQQSSSGHQSDCPIQQQPSTPAAAVSAPHHDCLATNVSAKFYRKLQHQQPHLSTDSIKALQTSLHHNR